MISQYFWDWQEEIHKYGEIHGSARSFAGGIGSLIGEIVAGELTGNLYLIAGVGISFGMIFQYIIDIIFSLFRKTQINKRKR